jgi:hypothetical protein
MSVELYLQRRGSLLVPVSAADEIEIQRLPERRVFTGVVDAKAPLRLKRWYRAMVHLLCEATGRWPSQEIAHRELLMRAGFFESFVISADGKTTRYTPASTVDWGLVEWRSYLDVVIPIIIRDYVGETRAEFRDRVDRFLGIKYKEAWEG